MSGCTRQILKQAHFNAAEPTGAAFNALELKEAGFSAQELHSVSVSASDSRDQTFRRLRLLPSRLDMAAKMQTRPACVKAHCTVTLDVSPLDLL